MASPVGCTPVRKVFKLFRVKVQSDRLDPDLVGVDPAEQSVGRIAPDDEQREHPDQGDLESVVRTLEFVEAHRS